MDGAMSNSFYPDSYVPMFSWPLKWGSTQEVVVVLEVGGEVVQFIQSKS